MPRISSFITRKSAAAELEAEGKATPRDQKVSMLMGLVPPRLRLFLGIYPLRLWDCRAFGYIFDAMTNIS